ncbi:LPS-assembly protein LptD [compost metagenome]
MGRRCLAVGLAAFFCLHPSLAAPALAQEPGNPEASPPAPSPSTPEPGAPATEEPGTPPGTPAGMRVKIKADQLTTDRATGISTARGNVRIEVQGVVITTGAIQFNQQTRTVSTDEAFTLVQADSEGKQQVIKGTGLHYDLATETATVEGAILTVPAKTPGQVVYIRAEKLISFKKERFQVENAYFTTCDWIELERVPHYDGRAEWMEYDPDDYMQGRNLEAYVAGRRVFWLPWFYIPLRRRETSFQIGRNNLEGTFIRSSWAYQINPNHTGNIYANLFEFPGNPLTPPFGFPSPPFVPLGPAVGVDHVWSAVPNSLSALTFYGLVFPDVTDYVPQYNDPSDPSAGINEAMDQIRNPWKVNGLDPSAPRNFQDHIFRLRHQQRWFGSNFVTDTWFQNHNIYDMQRLGPTFLRESLWTNPTQRYRDNHSAWFVGLNDNRWGTTYSLSRNFRDERGFSPYKTTQDLAQVNGNWGGTSVNFSLNKNNQQQGQLPGSIGTAPTGTITETNNLTVTQRITPQLQFNSNTNRTYNQSANSLSETLNQTLDLTQSADWGTLRSTFAKRYDLSPTPGSSLQQQYQRLGGLEKLPEIEFTSRSVLEQFQPLTLSAGVGRYFEPGQYNPSLSFTTAPINRVHGKVSAVSRQIGLPGNSQLDFGGTGLEQRLYSTGDAGAQFSTVSALTTRYTDWVNSNLSYRRDYTLPDSTSPFRFDNFSISKQNQLNAQMNFVAGDRFNWTHSTGYNYESRVYLPYNTGLTFRPNARMNFTLGTGYNFPQTPHLELKGGTWFPLNSTLLIRSSETAFGGVYGKENLVPGWQVNNTLSYDFTRGEFTALTNRFSISTGTTWQNHWELAIEGQFDVLDKQYKLIDIGINKDLHDFILGLTYNRRLEAYTINLAMVAFPTQLVNLSNKSFGGIGDPSQLIGGGSGSIW